MDLQDPSTLRSLAGAGPARVAVELAAWLGHDPAAAALSAPPPVASSPGDAAGLVRALVALCDWDVEALSRAALSLGAAALAATGDPGAALAPRLRAARAFVDCPCQEHARGLLSAAGQRLAGSRSPAHDAVDQACFLAFRAHDAGYTAELEGLAGLLVASALALGLEPPALDAAIRRDLVPWALDRARTIALVLEELEEVVP